MASISTVGPARIPIKSIWMLMAYALDLRFLTEKYSGSQVDNPDLLGDVIAEQYLSIVSSRLRRQLSNDYKSDFGELSCVRGRIDVIKSQRKSSFLRGKVYCGYTTLSPDSQKNRYIAGAIPHLIKHCSIPSIRNNLMALKYDFEARGVSVGANYDRFDFSRLNIADSLDLESLKISRLAHEMGLPSSHNGDLQFLSPENSDWWLRRLFEKAITSMLRTILKPKEYRVRGGTPLSWDFEGAGLKAIDYFPSMRADIFIEDSSGFSRAIIDTKFNEILTSGWMKDKTLRSGYIYQIYSYLRSQESSGKPGARTCPGLLLHPAVGYDFFDCVKVSGHNVYFATIDLSKDTASILNELEFKVKSVINQCASF